MCECGAAEYRVAEAEWVTRCEGLEGEASDTEARDPDVVPPSPPTPLLEPGIDAAVGGIIACAVAAALLDVVVLGMEGAEGGGFRLSDLPLLLLPVDSILPEVEDAF